MIKKLKRKFIVFATVSMLVFITVLVVIMNVVNYSAVVSESDAVLDILSNQVIPPNEPQPQFEKPFWDFGFFIMHDISPEVPYESRYFTATVSQSGIILKTDISKIISVDSETAQYYVEAALQNGNERGFAKQFRYTKTIENGFSHFIFLDCGRRIDSFKSFMQISIAVGILGCVAVFVIFIFAARRIVRPIAESYSKQKRFITDAGHEIKTPLTIIGANLDLLECDYGENESISDIRTQIKRLSELTGNLVYLSKMEEAEGNLKKAQFPLSELAEKTVRQFYVIAQAQSKDYQVIIEPGIVMNGSADAICRLISILLDNAMKYSPDNGVIRVNISADKKHLAICVFNTTKEAISKESLPLLFERFYRTENSHNSETGGYGIGLSSAQAIVAAHGGKITAETKNGFDLKITATMPLA